MSSPIDTSAALKHFKLVDPIMFKLAHKAIKSTRPVTIPAPKKPNEYFKTITNSIVSQQISVKAAAAVFGRVTELLGEVTPELINETDFESLKACGLSTQKTKYIKHNAAIWHEIPYGDFVHLPDEQIIHELTRLYGIGRWTAEMFLMFSMARPNVFSYGDLGLMQSLYANYHLKPHWHRKIATTVDAWAPHRTFASLCLWYHKDKVPMVL